MACALHAAPFVLGLIYGVGGLVAGECPSLTHWLLVQMVVSMFHMAMSIYLFVAMQKPFNRDDPKDRNLNARVQQMLCYDPWFALYILIALFQIAWLVLGSIWESGSSNDKECDDYAPIVLVVVILSWIYIGCGAIFFTCSWCCSATQDAAEAAGQAVERDLEQAQRSLEESQPVLTRLLFGNNSRPARTRGKA